MYNVTNITSANTPVGQINAVNNLSAGLLMTSLFLISFLLFLIVFKKQSFKKVLLADSFFMITISTIGYTLEWISLEMLTFPILLLFASLIIYKFVE